MEGLHIDTRFSSMSMEGPQPTRPRLPPREDSYQKDYGSNRNGSTPRTPRRSQTVYDYQPAGLPDGWTMMQSDCYARAHDGHPAADRIPSPIAEAHPALEAGDSDSMSVASNSSSDKNYKVAPAPVPEADARPRRPLLPPPRRSYSVMDYEPVPYTHRPSAVLALTDLPSEVHYNIFDHLDSIDGTCLGLTNKHFYAIHRRMHGTVPLTQRRAGPNDMEWAWHLAGNVRQNANSPVAPADRAAVDAVAAVAAAGGEAEKKALEKKALAMLRVRGHAYCRKCGISRCELHTHIKDWMGDEYEYCNVRQKYGPKAPEGAKSFCYMSNPKKPGRCGRHRVMRLPYALGQTDVQSPLAPVA